MSWSELLRTYLGALRVRNLSRRTLTIARAWCQRFVDFCREEGVGVPTAATPEHLARYRRRLEVRHPPLAAATRALAMRMVKAWLTWAARENHLLVNPARDLVVRHAPTCPRRFLTEEQAEQLMELPDRFTAIGLRDRALLETLYSAGVRAGECCGLELAHLDLGQRLLWVRRGKGSRDRLVPLGESLCQALTEYLMRGRPELLHPQAGGEPALFLNRFGGRLDYQSLRARIRHYMSLAGFTGRLPTAHSLRHSCATHMLVHGAGLREVGEFLGHARVSSTERYTHLQPLDLMAEHERTHPRARDSHRRSVIDSKKNLSGGGP